MWPFSICEIELFGLFEKSSFHFTSMADFVVMLYCFIVFVVLLLCCYDKFRALQSAKQVEKTPFRVSENGI